MPQNPDLIATKTITGEVFVFDRTKHPNQPKQGDDACKPNITLRGQSKEGYGIAWNPNDAKKGHILSTSEDMTVCHWDIMQYTKQNTVLEPLATYKAHTATVEDAAWHYSRPEIFASVGDDRRLILCVPKNRRLTGASRMLTLPPADGTREASLPNLPPTLKRTPPRSTPSLSARTPKTSS